MRSYTKFAINPLLNCFTNFFLSSGYNGSTFSYFRWTINSLKTINFLCEIKLTLLTSAAIVYKRYNFSIYKYFNKTSKVIFKYFLQMSTNVSRCFSDQSFPFPRMTTKLCFDKCKFFFFFKEISSHVNFSRLVKPIHRLVYETSLRSTFDSPPSIASTKIYILRWTREQLYSLRTDTQR